MNARTHRLLTALRRIRHHAQTIAGMCTRVEREIAQGEDRDEARIERKIRAIESRGLGLLRELGVQP